MKLSSVGDVIAVRELFLANEPSRKITVLMGKPQPFPDASGEDHYCPIQITGLGSEKVQYAGGVDAFQALELAFRLIGVELDVLNRNHGGQLRWECDDKGGFGFPEA